MSADELKAKGNAAFSAGSFREAAQFFTEAIVLAPDNHVLYSNRSAAHASLQQYESALEDARKTVELAPTWAKGYSRLGAAHYGLRQWADAAAAYSKGLQLDPANAQLKQGLADARAAAAPRPPPRPAYTAGATVQAGRLGELTLLAAHVLMLACAVLTVQPLARSLSWRAFYLFCRVSLVASAYKVYLRCGAPALRPFPAALAPWLQRVATSDEFFWFMLTTLMFQAPQLWMGVVPVAVMALFPTLGALGARFGAHPAWQRYGAPARGLLEQNKPSVLQFCATNEILLGFGLIVGILQSGLRGAMLAYVYFNSLRLRYWGPDSRAAHVAAWAALGARAAPLLDRVPPLRRYIDIVVNWFEAPGRQQHAQ